MSGRWWRAYDEAVDDPKLILLSDKQFRAWFNLCCVCSQNGGELPPTPVIAVKLRMTADKAKSAVAELAALGLVDVDGDSVTMHNWSGRQFQSDLSTERVKRFRKQKRNVSPAVSETPPEYRDRSREEEGETRARDPLPSKEPLISPAAFVIADHYREIIRVDDDDPAWQGWPWQVQTWLTQGHGRAEILAVAAKIPSGKPMGYHVVAVTNELAKPKGGTRAEAPAASPWAASRDKFRAAHAKLEAAVAAAEGSADSGGEVIPLASAPRRD